MGVDKTDYVMLCVELPEEIYRHKDFYDKYDMYIHGAESIQPFQIIYDGMNMEFARFGWVLAVGNEQDGFGYNDFTELSYTKQQEQEVANMTHELFGLTLPVRLIVFSVWS